MFRRCLKFFSLLLHKAESWRIKFVSELETSARAREAMWKLSKICIHTTRWWPSDMKMKIIQFDNGTKKVIDLNNWAINEREENVFILDLDSFDWCIFLAKCGRHIDDCCFNLVSNEVELRWWISCLNFFQWILPWRSSYPVSNASEREREDDASWTQKRRCGMAHENSSRTFEYLIDVERNVIHSLF